MLPVDYGLGGCDEEIPLDGAGFNTLTWELMGVDIAGGSAASLTGVTFLKQANQIYSVASTI